VRWSGPTPAADERQVIFDAFSSEVSKLLLELVQRRLDEDRIGDWQAAFNFNGPGSVQRRAVTVDDDIYGSAAPTGARFDANPLITEVAAILAEAATAVDVMLE
jgi:hypothetical protein